MPEEPTAIARVFRQLEAELAGLPPSQRALWEPHRVPPHSVSVESHPNETVVVVARVGNQVLYWSDIEEGWELETPTSRGGIRERGSSQFTLEHITHTLFGPGE